MNSTTTVPVKKGRLRSLSKIAFVLSAWIALAVPAAAAGSWTDVAQATEVDSAAGTGESVAGTESPSNSASPDGFTRARQRVEGEVRGLFRDPKGTVRRWFYQDGPRIAVHVFFFLFILFVSKVIAAFAERLVRRLLDKSAKKASSLFKAFVASSVSKFIFFVGLILALQNVGLDVAPILAGLGVMGFIIGFALQDTLANFAAGIMLLLYRPYDIGDFVEVAGKEGTVDAMTLVSTSILTPDNQKLTVPNGKIWGNVIRNASANDRRRTNEVVGIGYGDDLEHAQEIAAEVVLNLPHLIEEPAPQVLVTSLGDSSIQLSIRAWFPTAEYFASCCEMRKALKLRFDAENITIPYPQREIHIRGREDELGSTLTHSKGR